MSPLTIDPVARAFDGSAERYERGRPGFPEPVIGYLTRALRLRPGSTVIELGAGTGKLTRQLLRAGVRVVAVEPLPGMRRVFRKVVPRPAVLRAGTAEAIPMPPESADAVVAAQAFHWFHTDAALTEIARVLRPGGGLG